MVASAYASNGGHIKDLEPFLLRNWMFSIAPWNRRRFNQLNSELNRRKPKVVCEHDDDYYFRGHRILSLPFCVQERVGNLDADRNSWPPHGYSVGFCVLRMVETWRRLFCKSLSTVLWSDGFLYASWRHYPSASGACDALRGYIPVIPTEKIGGCQQSTERWAKCGHCCARSLGEHGWWATLRDISYVWPPAFADLELEPLLRRPETFRAVLMCAEAWYAYPSVSKFAGRRGCSIQG